MEEVILCSKDPLPEDLHAEEVTAQMKEAFFSEVHMDEDSSFEQLSDTQMKEVSIPSVNLLPEYARKMAVFSLLMKFTNQQVYLVRLPLLPC